eukprot:13350052-Alexandrium_andersonii.AAC.1
MNSLSSDPDTNQWDVMSFCGQEFLGRPIGHMPSLNSPSGPRSCKTTSVHINFGHEECDTSS